MPTFHRNKDVEGNAPHPLAPFPVSELSWDGLGMVKKNKRILENISGSIGSGQLLALMGPSGAGKSTMLDVLCRRAASYEGEIRFNGTKKFKARDTYSFVEQDDALYGVLTVRETVMYAARLSLPREFPDLDGHVDATLKSLGLQDVANNRIGTPLQRGISGGQKRRVTIACSVVARPRVLVLDEPTSGLDATSGFEVISSIKALAKETNMIVIATIHQPNWETFSLFDNLILLASGRVMYNGPVLQLADHLAAIGEPVPEHENPADKAIRVVNIEFRRKGDATDEEKATESNEAYINRLAESWEKSEINKTASHSKSESSSAHIDEHDDESSQHDDHAATPQAAATQSTSLVQKSLVSSRRTWILVERNGKNYSRNILAFGIRIAMYCGMALLMATTWINLPQEAANIQDRLSVFFFSVAFLGFMSVAGIPAYLEERSVFIRERSNGLYGPGSYVLANTITVVPFLSIGVVLFTVIVYWAIGLTGGVRVFFRFLLYLGLGITAAEFQSLLIATIVPIFVAALALAAFANGLWMVVQGYFIKATQLPDFWYYSFHYMDYQAYAFDLMVRNDFSPISFGCPTTASGGCACPVLAAGLGQADPATCSIPGKSVLESLGYATFDEGLYVGAILIIIAVFRFATWGWLVFKKR